ncbi:MAG TPA: peptidyl-prolyl cis-trans isomerase [Phycisphaerae bacterium]|nr:peptidyl-prolyl cis-trans isomerase [Phycisphaerae bacterium]
MNRPPAPHILGSIFLIGSLFAGCAQEDANRATAEQLVEKRSRETVTDSQPADDAHQNAGGPKSTRSSAYTIQSDGLLVNGDIVTVDDILEPIQQQVEDLAASLTADLYYRRVLELVRQEMVDNVANLLIYRRASETITEDMDKPINKAVDQMERERISREFHGLETEYENHLQKKKKTREDVRQRLRRRLIVDTYLRDRLRPLIPAASKKELRKYYDEHVAEFTTAATRELYLIDIPMAAFYDREILMRRRPPLPEEERAAEQKARTEAEAAMKALEEGRPFEEVAKQHSHGPHKEDGGNWGNIQSPMAGRWQVPYERFTQMKEGEVSEIIEASKAFFIVKVGDVQESTVKSFEDAQPEISQTLQNERFHRVKADFLQQELAKSTMSPLDQFVNQVMGYVPKPRSENENAAVSKYR